MSLYSKASDYAIKEEFNNIKEFCEIITNEEGKIKGIGLKPEIPFHLFKFYSDMTKENLNSLFNEVQERFIFNDLLEVF